jgi:cation:H+ antiporter
VAVSNILGGMAIQPVVLVALDAFGVLEPRPLTYQAPSLTLVIQGAVVLAALVVVVMGTQLPETLAFTRLTPAWSSSPWCGSSDSCSPNGPERRALVQQR